MTGPMGPGMTEPVGLGGRDDEACEAQGRYDSLTLLPGQFVVAPSADGAAVMIIIELTLESMLDVVNVSKAVFEQ